MRNARYVLATAVLVLTFAFAQTARASSISTFDLAISFSTGGTFVSSNLPLTHDDLAVIAGAEIPGAPVTYTLFSGGFNHTLSGSVTVDVSATSIAVSFSGTAQPGALTFTFTDINALTAITGFSSNVGSTSPLNGSLVLTPVVTADSVTLSVFLVGFEPGTSYTQTLGLTFAEPATPPAAVPEPASMALLGSGLVGLAARTWRRRRQRAR